jgi:hypothetical protein
MLTEDASYIYRKSGADENENETFRVHIDELQIGAKKIGSNGFDPRYFLNNDGSGNLYERLMFLYDNADNPKLTERHIKQEGNHVIMTLERTEERGTHRKRHVFDLSAGGNLIEYYSLGPTYEKKCEYEYEKKAGVWILRLFKKWDKAQHEGGILRSTRTVKWSNSVVNEPPGENEFTIEKLGVKPGDYIQDNKIGLMYEYRTGGIDLGIQDLLDTGDMSQVAVVTENDVVGADANEGETVVQEQDSDEVGTVPQTPILSKTTPAALDTDATRRYIYAVVVAVVVGLAAIAYMLTRRSGKE